MIGRCAARNVCAKLLLRGCTNFLAALLIVLLLHDFYIVDRTFNKAGAACVGGFEHDLQVCLMFAVAVARAASSLLAAFYYQYVFFGNWRVKNVLPLTPSVG